MYRNKYYTNSSNNSSNNYHRSYNNNSNRYRHSNDGNNSNSGNNNNYNNNNAYDNRNNGRSYNSNNNNDDDETNNAKSYNNNYRPRYRQNKSYYEADLKHTVEIVPTHFTSYQMYQYSTDCWKSKQYNDLDKLFAFTKAIRKSICGTKSETPMFVDPTINDILNSYEPGTKEIYEYFVEEQTPRPDGSKNFDEQIWIFMYISILPTPGIEITPTLQTFNILRNLSLEITMCETNYHRFDISKSNAGFLSKKESDVYMISEMKQWEPEEEEKAIKRVQGQHNKKLFYERKKIQEPVWQYYDSLRDTAIINDITDLSNPVVLNAWQIVSHNPTFPDNDSRFSVFFTRFKHTTKELVTNLTSLRNSFYNEHTTFDETKPTKEEVAEWLLIVPLTDLLEQLIEFIPNELSFATITLLDTHYISFMKTVLTISNELNAGIVRKAEKSQQEVSAYARDDLFIPYNDINLISQNNTKRIQRTINRLTWENLNNLSDLLLSFNPAILAQVIETELNSNLPTGFIAIKIMLGINAGIPTEKLKEIIEAKLNKRFGWNDDLSRLVGIAIVCGVYGTDYVAAFNDRVDFLINTKHQSPLYLVDGIMKVKDRFPNIIKILTPQLVAISSEQAKIVKTGFELAIASDTIEQLTGENVYNKHSRKMVNESLVSNAGNDDEDE